MALIYASQARKATLAALLGDLVERLADTLERICVRCLGGARRLALDHEIGATAHRIGQLALLGGVLNPGAVALGVHRKGGLANRGSCFGAWFLRVSHDC